MEIAIQPQTTNSKTPAALRVAGVRHSFVSRDHAGGTEKVQEVLKGVDFSLQPGEIVGLIGPSGGGKSVLLKIISGILTPDEGRATLGDLSMQEVHASLMFQEGALFDSLNVFDNVAFPIVGGKVPTTLLYKSTQREVHKKVMAILERVGLGWASHKFPGELSGGMRRRVSLARALVCDPEVLLLDDPTSGLDPVASAVIMDLIRELHGAPRTNGASRPTTLIVSHDLRRLIPAVEKVVALFDGQVRFEGTVEALKCIECSEVRTFVSCRYDFFNE